MCMWGGDLMTGSKSVLSLVVGVEPNDWSTLASKYSPPCILNFAHIEQAWLAHYLSLGYFGGSAP